jgi:hypothetical protein
MAAPERSRKNRQQRTDHLARRLGALVEGLSIARILKADDHEIVVELSDGTRMLVRTDGRLDISVT